ncbi:MAG: cupin domain-containing protein [Bacteroidetes bacterium]|nr:cupin domain-containing protein [Bacteroidota bacterium]
MSIERLITVEEPTAEKLNAMGVHSWPVWTKEESDFPWFYDETEVCYILEGHIIVTPEGGEPVEILPGQLVTFHKGLACRWQILKAVRKHYDFPS